MRGALYARHIAIRLLTEPCKLAVTLMDSLASTRPSFNAERRRVAPRKSSDGVSMTRLFRIQGASTYHRAR